MCSEAVGNRLQTPTPAAGPAAPMVVEGGHHRRDPAERDAHAILSCHKLSAVQPASVSKAATSVRTVCTLISNHASIDFISAALKALQVLVPCMTPESAATTLRLTGGLMSLVTYLRQHQQEPEVIMQTARLLAYVGLSSSAAETIVKLEPDGGALLLALLGLFSSEASVVTPLVQLVVALLRHERSSAALGRLSSLVPMLRDIMLFHAQTAGWDAVDATLKALKLAVKLRGTYLPGGLQARVLENVLVELPEADKWWELPMATAVEDPLDDYVERCCFPEQYPNGILPPSASPPLDVRQESRAVDVRGAPASNCTPPEALSCTQMEATVARGAAEQVPARSAQLVPQAMERQMRRIMEPQLLINQVVYDRNLAYATGGRPPSEQAAKQPKQELAPLSFESRFESANLCRAVWVYPNEYDLVLSADMNDGDMRTQWFYFAVSGGQPEQLYRFNLINHGKKESLFNDAMRPLVYSAATGRWERAGEEVGYYPSPYFTPPKPSYTGTAGARKGPAPSTKASKWNILRGADKSEGSGFYSLHFAYRMKSSGPHFFAMCFPYPYTQLQQELEELCSLVPPTPSDPLPPYHSILRRSLLATTLAGHRCDLLTVTSFKCPPSVMASRKRVVISARVHPGESNASWIMKGVTEFLLSSAPEAALLREKCVFKLIPMLNPDGVVHGSYRCSLAGVDLNRCWARPLKHKHPTISAAKRVLKKASASSKLALFCDLHGHSLKRDAFFHGCDMADGACNCGANGQLGHCRCRQRVRVLPMLVARRSPHFCLSSCSFTMDQSKASAGRVVVARELGVVNSFTLEASLAGPAGTGAHFTTRDLEELGKSVCLALLDLCTGDLSKLMEEVVLPSDPTVMKFAKDDD
ncbi:hypothetical protein CYMTET_22420 [Cymbomonas tetramitiformis]|uniref:Peptidase M14 domain-containing protein n=1 Tax=Cymbomonas tetramitiformis TaxID=36881 RepID=A0AAE0L1X9_9CHLO|nr:hypothetical protein CYMTET_22420 [Cymbomonas tetramitiformis]